MYIFIYTNVSINSDAQVLEHQYTYPIAALAHRTKKSKTVQYSSKRIFHRQFYPHFTYGVALVSRIDQIIGLFCNRGL